MIRPPVAGPLRRAGTLARRGWAAVVAVLPQVAVSHLVVLASLGVAHLVVDRAHPAAAVAARAHEGLLGWDAGAYQAIAHFGYGALGRANLRFFPAVPVVTRGIAAVTGLSDGIALLVLANVCSLVGTALLLVLVRRERASRGDADLAARTTWLLALAPPAFVFVMGYAESALLVASVACFLAIRPRPGHRPAWGWAALFGYVAALTRPLGVLVAFAVAIEAVRWWRQRGGWAARSSSLGAVAAPVAGLATFLGWSAAAFGDFLLPLRVQTSANLHGGFADPVRTVVDDARGVVHHHFGTALHVPWVVLVVVLVVVCWARWPASYAAFATAVVVVALSGANLDSFERYSLSAFPLVMTGASLMASNRVARVVLAVAAAGLFGYAMLAFLNLSVP